MSLIKNNQYLLSLSKKNFKCSISFLQPYSLMPRHLANILVNEEPKEQPLLLKSNHLTDLKQTNNLILANSFTKHLFSNNTAEQRPELIVLNHADGIVEAQLNRPQGKNALSKQLLQEVNNLF